MNEEILKILSEEKNKLQNMLTSVQDINKYQKEPFNNLYKIKQDLIKVEKTLEQSKLEDLVREEIKKYK